MAGNCSICQPPTAAGLGHGHPEIAAAITRAAQNPAGAGGLSAVHPDSVGLAEELLAITPGNGDRCVYLGHAGSDANDVALRACRLASGKRKVVAFAHGYHGGIGLAMEVSGVHISAGNAADPDLYPQLIQIHSEPMMKALRQSAQAFTKLKNSSIKVMWLV